MGKIMRGSASLALVLLMAISTVIPVSAASSVGERASKSGERVIQIAIPDQNGELQIYKGDEAQAIYNQLESVTNKEIPAKAQPANPVDIGDLNRGMFTYRYRFVQQLTGVTWGTSKRISTYVGNESSAKQSKKIHAATSVSWSINTTLSGRFRDVFVASVGGSWQHTSGFDETITVNVMPKKRVWLEFKPRVKYIRGEAQKYYITRGPRQNTVITERRNVSTTSPTMITMTLGDRKISVPDGSYIWKEDGNYLSI